jgi:hypothetical protein
LGGNILDQNTTTVLTTLIAAGSPLIALYLGIILGRKQEDRKWKKEIKEEFYELTLKIRRHTNDFFGSEKLITNLSETIAPYTLRIALLANLYLRSIKPQLSEFIDSLGNVDKTHEKFFLISPSEDTTGKKNEEAFENMMQAIELFEEKYKNLKDSLEKLK